MRRPGATTVRRVYLRRLVLANFRCYRQLDLTLPCGTVVVSGRNAQGKSSLLEAIYVLATTRSPHAASDRDLIHWADETEPLPFARVWGEVHRAGGSDTVEVVAVLQPTESEPGDRRLTRRARVNGAERRALDVIGTLNVVLFTPRDLQIVDGGPVERRRYLDVLRCQVDHAYCLALARYNKAVTQRNHLLRRLRDRGGDHGELAFWDDQVSRDGSLLLQRRLSTVAELSALAGAIHAELAGAPEPLVVHYRASLDGVQTMSAAITEAFAAALAARRDEEIARGMTLVGPHRDDLGFAVGGVDMRTFGSRGQQRTVTLALKLAEARLMWHETGERPVLLLDDVLSELDADRRACLLSHVDAHQQTFLTTTEVDRLPPGFLSGARVLVVEGAAVSTACQAGQDEPDGL